MRKTRYGAYGFAARRGPTELVAVAARVGHSPARNADPAADSHARLPLPSPRLDALGRGRPASRRHRHHDLAQGRDDVDPAHREPARLPDARAAEHTALGVAVARL